MAGERRAKVPVFETFKGLVLEDLFIEDQPGGSSIVVIQVAGQPPARISLVKRAPGDATGMLVRSDGWESVITPRSIDA